MSKGLLPQQFIPNANSNETESDEEDELPIEKPIRSSKRSFKQITTFYDDVASKPAVKRKNIGRKIPENVEMQDDLSSAGLSESKVQCPIDYTRLIYNSIWISENAENCNQTKCDICMGDDDDEGDEMVLCDGCNVCTHQTCYGREILNTLPQGSQWFCQRC